MTPQIDRLGKTSTVLRVSTHTDGVPQEIDGKMFIFRVNIRNNSKPRHVTPQIECLGKTSTVLSVSTHIYGVSKEIDGKMFIFRVNIRNNSKPRHVTPKIEHFGKMTPQIDCLGKTSTVLSVSTHIYGVSKEIDGITIHF